MGVIQKQGTFNAVIGYIGIVIGFVNVLILQPYMLSPDELGLTRILYSTAALLGTIFPLGLNGVTIKFLPIYRNNENGNKGFLGLLLLLASIFCVVLIAGVYIFKAAIISKYSASSPLFVEYFNYIIPLTISSGFVSILNVYFFAQFKSTFPTFLNEIYVRILLIIILSLYFLKVVPFEWFMRFYVLVFVSQLAILFYAVLKTELKSFKIDWSFFDNKKIKGILSFSLTMAMATIASVALRNIDIIIIGSYLSLSDVAIYTIAITIAGIIEAPASALGKIADSKISDNLSKNNLEEVKQIYFKSTRLLMLVGFFLYTIIVVNIHELLSFLPLKYGKGENVVIIVSLSALFNMITGVNSSIIFYSNKHKQGTVLLVSLIISSVLLNLWLIPKYGIVGAAIATSLNLFFFNFFKYLMIYYYFKFQPYGKYVWIVIGMALLSIGICKLIDLGTILNLFLRTITIVAIFTSTVFYFNLAPEMNEFVRKMLVRFKLVK